MARVAPENWSGRLRAELRLLPASEGGISSPRSGSYRPEHALWPGKRQFAMGAIQIPDGPLEPGESREVVVSFLTPEYVATELRVGGEWEVYEGGSQLGGRLTLLEFLP